jgi:hypothetical protein
MKQCGAIGHPGSVDVVGLEAELRYLLNRWDPIGVYVETLDFPPDEYDCLLAPLLQRLSAGAGRAEVSEFLWYELEDHFGLDPVPRDPDALANRLVAWYAVKAAAG